MQTAGHSDHHERNAKEGERRKDNVVGPHRQGIRNMRVEKLLDGITLSSETHNISNQEKENGHRKAKEMEAETRSILS